MPSSHYEPVFYSLCLKAQVPMFPLMQDLKQTIEKKKLKNIDFICYSEKKIFLIDVKGSNRINGDTKVSDDDILALDILKDIYGTNAVPLIVYMWMKEKIDYVEKDDLLLQKFRVKAIDLKYFSKTLQWSGTWSKGTSRKYHRCYKSSLRNIWDYIPNFKNLIVQASS